MSTLYIQIIRMSNTVHTNNWYVQHSTYKLVRIGLCTDFLNSCDTINLDNELAAIVNENISFIVGSNIFRVLCLKYFTESACLILTYINHEICNKFSTKRWNLFYYVCGKHK